MTEQRRREIDKQFAEDFGSFPVWCLEKVGKLAWNYIKYSSLFFKKAYIGRLKGKGVKISLGVLVGLLGLSFYTYVKPGNLNLLNKLDLISMLAPWIYLPFAHLAIKGKRKEIDYNKEFLKFYSHMGFKEDVEKNLQYPKCRGMITKREKTIFSFYANKNKLSSFEHAIDILEEVVNMPVIEVRKSEYNKGIVEVVFNNGSKKKIGIVKWNDSYIKEHGIFNVGVNLETEKEYIIDFAINANILVGGAPGAGKTKFMQMIAYQAILQNSKVYIGDFKGGADFQKFNTKCTVVTSHTELVKLLKAFHAEHKRRIKLFLNVGAENLEEYNQITGSDLKREYLIIDELGEAVEIIDVDVPQSTRNEIEKTIDSYLKSIARLGRSTGENLVLGTQRPDVGILQGQTRDQFLKRVCFQAVKQTSNIVLNNPIAETIGEKDKGRCYINSSTGFTEVQIYLFEKDMIKNLPNKGNENKANLKVVGKNTFLEKSDEIEVVDIDIDD